MPRDEHKIELFISFHDLGHAIKTRLPILAPKQSWTKSWTLIRSTNYKRLMSPRKKTKTNKRLMSFYVNFELSL